MVAPIRFGITEFMYAIAAIYILSGKNWRSVKMAKRDTFEAVRSAVAEVALTYGLIVENEDLGMCAQFSQMLMMLIREANTDLQLFEDTSYRTKH